MQIGSYIDRGVIATLTFPMQFCRKNFCVVENKRVAGLKQFGKIADMAIVKRTNIRIYNKKPRRIARVCRAKCDALLWQIKIEKIGTHGMFLSCLPKNVRRLLRRS